MRILPVLLLVPCLAFADAPVFTARTLSAADTAEVNRIKARKDTLSVQPIVSSPHAINSTVITAKIDGKEHRFVGKVTEYPDARVWTGDGPTGRANLSVGKKGVLVGSILLDGPKLYTIERSGSADFLVGKELK